MKNLLLFSVFCAITFFTTKTVADNLDDEGLMTIPEILAKYGYPCEEHFVTTPSGYILRLQRIPHGKNEKASTKPPVFLLHGILLSSADWVITGPDHALGYVLADNGYDVWMGNARGNALSRNHTFLDPDHSDKFWDFSWHEIGMEDIPTMIDYVLEQTSQKDLFYIGHSQGSTSFFVMASSRPEYNAKIRAQFSLAPVAYTRHSASPLLQIIAFWYKPISMLLHILNVNEIFPNNHLFKVVADNFCTDNNIFQGLCTNALFILFGFSPKEMNATILPVLGGHSPAGASTRQHLHYFQEIRSGHFRQYDYGLSENIKKYHSMSPPDYNLKQITAPVYLFYSRNDWLAAERDVNNLYSKLPNVLGKFLNGDNHFNHLDFLYGIYARETVYNKVLNLMTRH